MTVLAEDEDYGASESAELVRRFRTAGSQEEMARSFKSSAGRSCSKDFPLPRVPGRPRKPRPSPRIPAHRHFHLSRVLRHWQEEEERIGIEVDLRIMTYYLSQSDEIDRVISDVGGPPVGDRSAWRSRRYRRLCGRAGKLIRLVSPSDEEPLRRTALDRAPAGLRVHRRRPRLRLDAGRGVAEEGIRTTSRRPPSDSTCPKPGEATWLRPLTHW